MKSELYTSFVTSASTIARTGGSRAHQVPIKNDPSIFLSLILLKSMITLRII